MVTIIGKGQGWADAPDEGEIWGITQLILRRPVSLVIDMNVYSDGRWGENERREADRAREMAGGLGIPYIDLASYPVDEITKFFGTDYFSNTVDYAMALAVYRGFKRIDLYGVNMANGTEYAYQKPGVDFWCGMAMGRGVTVNVFGAMSTIMKTGDGLMYGYGTPQK